MDEQLFPKGQPRQQLSAPIASLATRLKLADDKYANLVRRNQITEESLLALEREIKSELRAITLQAVDLRKHIDDVNMKIDTILGELSVCVRRNELAVVERYVDLWQPVQFLTRAEAKRMLEQSMIEQSLTQAPNNR